VRADKKAGSRAIPAHFSGIGPRSCPIRSNRASLLVALRHAHRPIPMVSRAGAGYGFQMVGELRLFIAACRALSLRPIARRPVPEGVQCFGAMGDPQYGQLVVGLLIVLLIEAPLVHLLLGAALADGPWQTLVRASFALTSVYVGIWLIGDLRLLRESHGVCVGPGTLHVDLGRRVQGTVALADIGTVDTLATPPDHDGKPIRISPYPEPNVRVELRRPVAMSGSFGRQFSGDRLHIYVDDAAALVRAIRRAQAESERGRV
jgi:hypothetical protein